MLFIARRYLFSKKSHSVINIIAGVSVVSVAIPVAAIIILLSIFNGFGSLVEGMNKSIDTELTITPSEGYLFDTNDLDISQIEGVANYTFVNEQMVMLQSEGHEAVVSLRGVDDNVTSVLDIERYILVGSFTPRLGDLDRLVIGNAMAGQLGIRNLRTSWIKILALRESPLSSFAPMVDFAEDRVKIAGIYMLDMESEGRYAYAPRRLVAELTSTEGKATSVGVITQSGESISKVQKRLQDALGDDFSVRNREELNPVLYDIIRYEKWGIIFISTMVMLLASLSLIGIVTMLIIEKREDMTTLRAMGCTWSNIRGIFFWQGVLISGVGAVIGMLIGIGVTLIQQYFGVVKLPAGGFVVDAYPVNLEWGDVAGVMIVTLTIGMILNYFVTREMIKR